MTKFNSLIITLCVIQINLYAQKIRTNITNQQPILEFSQTVHIYSLTESIPNDAIFIGNITIGDSGFTINCNYDDLIKDLQLEARKHGANAIKITKHRAPNLVSSCHYLETELYTIQKESVTEAPPVNTEIPKDFALIHFYRNSGIGPLVQYDINLGEDIICTTKNKWKTTVALSMSELAQFWSATETKSTISIPLEKGKEYYVRCKLIPGVLMGRPKLELVDNISGKAEFDAIAIKEKNKRNLLFLNTGEVIICKIKSFDQNYYYVTTFPIVEGFEEATDEKFEKINITNIISAN